jgi:uncharacterized protein YecE (DUF72 family)
LNEEDAMQIYVGASGWQYRGWSGSFYPECIPQRTWFAYYASQFNSLEINNTFYCFPVTYIAPAEHSALLGNESSLS